MPLTPEEQAELASLQSSAPAPQQQSKPSGLTPEEAEELKALSAGSSKSSSPEMYENFGPKANDIMDSLKGYTSGATLGAQNIIGGGVQSGLDALQSGLHNVGLTGESPTQVAARLKAQGATGDVGPTSEKDMYYKGKHETETDFDAAEKRSPYLYGAGQLAGGFATPGMAAINGVSGALIKGGTVGAKIARGALTGTQIGAAAGFLGGHHDLAGDNANAGGVLADVGAGSITGAAVGGGLSALGAGASALQEKANPMLKKFASNRAAAAVGIPSAKNTITNAAGKEVRNVGQTLLDEDLIPAFKNTDDTIAGMDAKLSANEKLLQTKLEEAELKTNARQTPENNNYQKQIEEVENLKNQRIAKAQEAKQSVPGESPAISSEDINPDVEPNAPGEFTEDDGNPIGTSQDQTLASSKNVKVEPSYGDLDEDTVNQLRSELHPFASSEDAVASEVPSTDSNQLANDINAKPEVPAVDPELPVGTLKLPESILNANELENEINKIITVSTKTKLNTASDQQLRNKIINEFYTPGEDGLTTVDKIKRAGNSPLQLNELKREIGAKAKAISDTIFQDRLNAPKMAQAHDAVYDLLKNQVEKLADATGGELGQSIKKINRTSSEILQAKQNIDPNQAALRLHDLYPRPINNANLASKVITGKPLTALGNIGLAKSANQLSKIPTPNDAFVQGASKATDAIVNKKVQKNLYNRSQEDYKRMSDKLKMNPSTAHLGAALGDSLNNNNSLSKTQALFVIGQNPQAKKLINDDSEDAG